nr:GNAT family N-acetyltransferase [Fictibacillus sp. FJAT-27399]
MLTAIVEKGAYHLVYKDRDKVGGWIMIGHNTDYFTEIEIGFIYDVYILQDYRGRGLSKKLVEAGISELKEKGYEE